MSPLVSVEGGDAGGTARGALPRTTTRQVLPGAPASQTLDERLRQLPGWVWAAVAVAAVLLLKKK
jgi:hypothetical protein